MGLLLRGRLRVLSGQPSLSRVEEFVEMWMLISELMRARTREYLASSPLSPDEMPGLRPPATPAQVREREALAGQPLDPEYRRFLSLTDGLDGFQYTMPLLGCRDWKDPERSGLGSIFRDIVLEAGPLTEAGKPGRSLSASVDDPSRDQSQTEQR
ncbi:hypothetical protein [Streptomyces sp. NPDC014676]|uniref:hypothetical protein n=1 Tax=Streptomyces sp. NPDC014676 TaxID=3364879 RepID=UPI0036F64D91